MEAKDKESVIESAEKEVANIVQQRSTTAFEKRMEALRDEIEVTANEFSLRGVLHSGMFAKKVIELRCKAVRDIILGRFNTAKEVRSKYGLRWTDSSLDTVGKDLEECIEGQFSAHRNALQEQVGRMYKPNDSIMEWAFRELEKETSKLSAEVAREIEALRSELKIQAITSGPSSQRGRTIQINISGGQIGILNVAGIIDTIEQNLSFVSQTGNQDVVEAIKNLTEAVVASKDLKENQIQQALESLEFLSGQPALPPEKRSKGGVISAVFGGLRQLVSSAADLSQVWSTWGPKLEAALRSMGIL
jgi:hypothetical protein